jgi:fructosamine-3-kinase
VTTRFRKHSSTAPPGYFRWEAAGLRWLADALPDAVVTVLEVGDHHLDLPLLAAATPTPVGAERLGRDLATIHAAGAAGYGAGPDGWTGDGWLGPLSEPLPLVLGRWERWGEFYAQARIRPTVARGLERGAIDAGAAEVFERLADRLEDGVFDTGGAAARCHGDLWAGNVLWTADRAVLIDPAAHGAHPESDLAMLALFGAPHTERIIAGYESVSPLAAGWQGRVLLHQVHPLLMHAVLFGGGYRAHSLRAASAYL